MVGVVWVGAEASGKARHCESTGRPIKPGGRLKGC